MTRSPQRIVVFGAEPAGRGRIARAAGRDGVGVTETGDVADVARSLATDDVVLVVVMAGGEADGDTLEELHEILRQRHRSVAPVVVVDTAGCLVTRLGALHAGADDVVDASLDDAELAARFGAHTRRHATWVAHMTSELEGRTSAASAISRRALGAGGVTDKAQVVCDEFVATDGVRRVAVFELTGAEARLVASQQRDGAAEMRRDTALPAGTLPIGSDLAADSSALLSIIDPRNLHPTLATSLPPDVRGMLVFSPLAHDGRQVGLLMVEADDHLSDSRSLALAAVADLGPVIGAAIGPALSDLVADAPRRAAIRQIIELESFGIVFQPILHMTSMRIVGFEALTRFDNGERPDVQFHVAAQLGLGRDLELVTLQRAFVDARRRPFATWLSVNVSAETVVDDAFGRLVRENADLPLVIELTEHQPIDDYPSIQKAVAGIDNARIAVDDAGSGYSSLRHIMRLDPTFVKLDRTWVQDIDEDPARRALISGLVSFVNERGGNVVAEGVERSGELDVLRELGATHAQGYLLGRPAPMDQIVESTDDTVLPA
jgi:EAL domain-containing protein (putative c-di-GMP-specific phosphodiesterase class I)/DNA-binding response OmpR family regulator